ncbi:hypothetical protein [Peribacillus asahii]|uniref:hypothetical protein n=1 Tax=Peribacillus asahii TaxID=228899 RepID=UPI002079FA79|nr:hypothetical protein [Peribacillus asahii]USK72716.1 hypothetical protein LIS76_24020 [Peribacillus asahii]
MEYIDPIPHVVALLKNAGITVYGNAFQPNPVLPAVLVRVAGGTGYTRLQLISRAEADYEAMANLITAMNYLERNAQFIQGIRVLWIEKK